MRVSSHIQVCTCMCVKKNTNNIKQTVLLCSSGLFIHSWVISTNTKCDQVIVCYTHVQSSTFAICCSKTCRQFKTDQQFKHFFKNLPLRLAERPTDRNLNCRCSTLKTPTVKLTFNGTRNRYIQRAETIRTGATNLRVYIGIKLKHKEWRCRVVFESCFYLRTTSSVCKRV